MGSGLHTDGLACVADAASADSSPARGEHGDSRVPRMCRRKRERSGSAGETEEATVSVTRAVQLSMRK